MLKLRALSTCRLLATTVLIVTPLWASAQTDDVQSDYTLQLQTDSIVNYVALSPNAKMFSATDGDQVFLYETASGKIVQTLAYGSKNVFRGIYRKIKSHGYEEPFILSLDFSRDGNLLAACRRDGIVVVWDLAANARLKTVIYHDGLRVQFSPDGTMLAVGGYHILLWDIVHQKKRTLTPNGCAGLGESIAFSPDGRLLASGVHNEKVALWNVFEGKQINSLDVGRGPVTCMAFSPDGKTLAFGAALSEN